LPILTNGLMTRLDAMSAWLPLIGQDMLACCVSFVLLLLIFKEKVGQPVTTALVIPICRLGFFFPFFAGQNPDVLVEFLFEVIAPLIQELVIQVQNHTETCKMCSRGTRTCILCAFSYKITTGPTHGAATLKKRRRPSFKHLGNNPFIYFNAQKAPP
jgi:hypothetical protein